MLNQKISRTYKIFNGSDEGERYFRASLQAFFRIRKKFGRWVDNHFDDLISEGICASIEDEMKNGRKLDVRCLYLRAYSRMINFLTRKIIKIYNREVHEFRMTECLQESREGRNDDAGREREAVANMLACEDVPCEERIMTHIREEAKSIIKGNGHFKKEAKRIKEEKGIQFLTNVCLSYLIQKNAITEKDALTFTGNRFRKIDLKGLKKRAVKKYLATFYYFCEGLIE